MPGYWVGSPQAPSSWAWGNEKPPWHAKGWASRGSFSSFSARWYQPAPQRSSPQADRKAQDFLAAFREVQVEHGTHLNLRSDKP
eukprot:6016989-Lingulodinium_polyedra.AAC.1